MNISLLKTTKIDSGMVISILGVRGSGKDFFALELKKKYEQEGKNVHIVGFSDGVRETTFKQLGLPHLTDQEYEKFKGLKRTWRTDQYISDAKEETGRFWLEYFGESARLANPNHWPEYLLNKCNDIPKEDVIIISDCRFATEVDMTINIAMFRDSEYQFYFCDHKSHRYDDQCCPTNELALFLRGTVAQHREDVTQLIKFNRSIL